MSKTPALFNSKGTLFLIFLALWLASCSPKEDITKRALLNKPPNYLLARIQDPAKDLNWFSAKAATVVDKNGKENSFKSNFKLRKDSLVWVSLSPALGIEIVRAIVSLDSVQFIKNDFELIVGQQEELERS